MVKVKTLRTLARAAFWQVSIRLVGLDENRPELESKEAYRKLRPYKARSRNPEIKSGVLISCTVDKHSRVFHTSHFMAHRCQRRNNKAEIGPFKINSLLERAAVDVLR
jgi:hypothetical protein